MTKKHYDIFARFARKKGEKVVHFSGESPKNEQLPPFFARAKRVRKAFAFFVMYFTVFY
jgi:hypothetical protein